MQKEDLWNRADEYGLACYPVGQYTYPEGHDVHIGRPMMKVENQDRHYDRQSAHDCNAAKVDACDVKKKDNSKNASSGAVHKVRHARGGGGPRRCDSLWQRGGGKEHVTSHL